MLLSSRNYTILNLLVLSVVIYGGVDIFYTLAGSRLADVTTEQIASDHLRKTITLEDRPAFNQYLPATKRGLFGVVKESAEPSEPSPEDLEPTELDVKLLGTVSGDKNAVAVIKEVAKKTQALYKEGDSIEDATIVKILRGQVILRVGEKNQVLNMEEDSSPSSSSRPTRRGASGRSGLEHGTTITLDHSTVAESLDDINELLSQVRVRPHYKNGKADGLMLSQLKPNTVFTKMRLRNGDVVQSVNGQAITSPDDIMEFYEELKSGSSVSLEISRRGKSKTMTYNFR